MASKQAVPRIEPSELPPLMTIEQGVATGAGCARQLRKMCAEGAFKATRCGSRWRINRDDFLTYFGLI